MTTWSSIIQPYGEYVSESFNISNSLDRYISLIDTVKINIHNQTLNFFYSTSYDDVYWTDWMPFREGNTDILDGYDLSDLRFRYKVIISSIDELQKPYLQSISFSLLPYKNIENVADMPTKPKIWIRKLNGKGDISLTNHMTNQTITIKNLQENEEIYIDNENEEIISSLQDLGVYRHDDHNDEWLELIRGDNYIKGTGDFDMDIRYQGILIQK